MQKQLTLAAVLVSGLVLGGVANAGIIQLADGSLRAQKVEGAPKAGRTKADVLKLLGEPEQRVGEVGDPPISSWRYGTFQVYFEHNLVLHTVGL